MGEKLDNHSVATLICNVGAYHDKTESLDNGYAAQQWAETFSANVTGVFLCIQALLRNLRQIVKAGHDTKIAIISSKNGQQQQCTRGCRRRGVSAWLIG